MKHSRIAPAALAVIVAASVSATPLAAVAQDSQTASTHAAASVATSVATPIESVSIPETWTATAEENQAILEQAKAAELPGYTALEAYLNGKAVASAAFLEINVDVLKPINEDLAKLVASTQATIKQSQEQTPAEPVTPAPTDPKTDAGSDNAGSGSTSASSEPADNAANDVEDAPGDMVQESELLADDIVYVVRNLTTQQFIDTIGEDARELCQQNDLYASVMIAQAVVESASGSSGLSCEPYNNLFGIKGSFEGKSVRMKTQEDDGEGNLETIVAEFRRYPSLIDSLQDYVGLLTGNSLYTPVKKSNTASYTDACDYLQGHYATSTSYARTLKAYIDAYDLTQYDKPADQAKEETTLENVLKPTATHAVFTTDASTFATAVPEPGMPQRKMSPLVGGLLAALAAAAAGAAGYWLYWRRKVENEHAFAGAHAVAGDEEPAGTNAEADGARPLDAEWLSEVIWDNDDADAANAKHAAAAKQPAHAAKSDDPTNPMGPVLPPLE